MADAARESIILPRGIRYFAAKGDSDKVALKLVDNGAYTLLNQLAIWFAANCVLHLYKNNYTPVEGSTSSNFTEADFTGYAPVALASWSLPVLTPPYEQVTSAAVPFTVGTVGVGNTIYGYYVTDLGGALLWAERDPNAPIAMTATGNQYTVIPRFSMQSLY
jgi:hypothetical protein